MSIVARTGFVAAATLCVVLSAAGCAAQSPAMDAAAQTWLQARNAMPPAADSLGGVSGGGTGRGQLAYPAPVAVTGVTANCTGAREVTVHVTVHVSEVAVPGARTWSTVVPCTSAETELPVHAQGVVRVELDARDAPAAAAWAVTVHGH